MLLTHSLRYSPPFLTGSMMENLYGAVEFKNEMSFEAKDTCIRF